MSSIVKDGLIVIGFFIALILVFIFRYLFPHFSMHFFKEGKFGGMAINSKYFNNTCGHTRNDIEKYKRRQIPILIVLSIVTIVIVVIYLGSII